MRAADSCAGAEKAGSRSGQRWAMGRRRVARSRVARASWRQAMRGASRATAAIEKSPAQATCSAVVNPSVLPKNSPLPSTAIDCHQSLKLLVSASPLASPVWVAPACTLTFSWCISARVSRSASRARAIVASSASRACVVVRPGLRILAAPAASSAGSTPTATSRLSEAMLAPTMAPTTRTAAASGTAPSGWSGSSIATSRPASRASENQVGEWSLRENSRCRVWGAAQMTSAPPIAPAQRPAMRHRPHAISPADASAMA